jgi:hypothetical protein
MPSDACGGDFEVIDGAPVAGAEPDHQQKPTSFHHGAEHVHPHGLADATQHHSAQHEHEAERDQGDLRGSADELGQVRGEDPRPRRD